MKRNHLDWRSIFFVALIVTLPILLFALVLSIRLPFALGNFFRSYSVWLFLVVLGLFTASFYLPGKWGWLAGLSLTLLLFAMVLSFKWTTGFSNNKLIAAFLPYKDAYFHYLAGREIISGNLIPTFNLASSWRPLYAGFLSILLLLSGINLQASLAIITAMTAIACYLASRQVFKTFGTWPAAIFITLLYLYAHKVIGESGTEQVGLLFGCLGFYLLWQAAIQKNLATLLLGTVTLTTALSIRAGAFFILPMLILWAGWIFRKGKRFSVGIASLTLLVTAAAYLAVNTLYPRMVVETGTSVMGNLAQVVYGQVLGGAGWHRAVEDLGTSSDTGLIYQAAWQVFLQHPESLLIAIFKSIRDTFLPGDGGIFSFITPGGMRWTDYLLWILSLVLLGWSCLRAWKKIQEPLYSLLLASFAGMLLSIPFLPPIDGGRRFYAASIPLLAGMIACGLFEFLSRNRSVAIKETTASPLPTIVRIISLIFVIGIATAPPIIQRTVRDPDFATPTCPAGQVPFVVEVTAGSYIDLIPPGESTCGLAPEICLQDFEQNGAEPYDDFYQAIIAESDATETSIRIFPGKDLVDGYYHFFIGEGFLLPSAPRPNLVTGCAIEIRTDYQSIYRVQAETNP